MASACWRNTLSSSASSAAVAVRGDDSYVQGTGTVTAAISSATGGTFEALTTSSTMMAAAASPSVVELAAPVARQSDLPLDGTPLGRIPLGGLLDELPGLIYRGDNNPRWSMQFVSAGCLQLTGYPAEYLTRTSEHSYGSLILAEYADYIWYCVQCALLQHEPYQLSYRIRCSDGQIKDVWEKGVGVYSADGEVLGVEGAIFEVRG